MIAEISNRVIGPIRELYREDEVARSFFDWAASRVNDSVETSLDRLIQKLGVTRQKAIGLSRQLEDLDCGRFVVGRKGAKSRMTWFYSLRSLGRAAQGIDDDLEDVDPEIAAEAGHQINAMAEEASEMSDGIDHKFRLRPDRDVVFRLPEDLTKKEAERLAAFIQSLPFGD